MGALGATIACTFGAGALGLTLVSLPFISPAFRRVCIPFVPATDQQLKNVVQVLSRLSKTTPIDPIIDLGSGDGRVVMECAKLGYQSVGVELNYPLVLLSRLRAGKSGLRTKTKFIRKDIFKLDLSPYKSIILFGTESSAEYFIPKLREDIRPGSTLIMCRFPLPENSEGWQLFDSEGSGMDRTWVYRKLGEMH